MMMVLLRSEQKETIMSENQSKCPYTPPRCESFWLNQSVSILETFSSMNGLDLYTDGENLGESEDTTW